VALSRGARPRLDFWGKKLLPVVQQDLARIAVAIARFEPRDDAGAHCVRCRRDGSIACIVAGGAV
jgi:hypothetical protein